MIEHALATPQPIEPIVIPTAKGVTKFGDLHTEAGFWSVITHGIDLLLIFGGAFAFIALLYAGFMYITSGGDASKNESAKQIITYAVIGIIIIILSEAVVRFIIAIG